MLILGIETSCDETAAAIVENGRIIRSSAVHSQVEQHKKYGGVVPEIASRAHVEAICALTEQCLTEADIKLCDIDAVAVTYAPGLIGALLVGVNFAKSLAYKIGKPLVPVHHIRGHIASLYLRHPRFKPPNLAFVASGGHTSIIAVRGYCAYETVAQTCDDAAGEAFDKIGRVMDVPYPGGKEIDRLASIGDPGYLPIPHAKVSGNELDFSFSGIKTYVINHINTLKQKNGEISEKTKADIAASFTKNVIGAVIARIDGALKKTGMASLSASGGVMANSHITAALKQYCAGNGIALFLPTLDLCGDNAAMIAAQGYYELAAGHTAGIGLNACAVKNIGENYMGQ